MTTFTLSRFANGEAVLLRGAAFALAANILFALIGPFGTMLTMAWPQRFAHWIVSGCAIAALTIALLAGVRRFRPAGPTPLWIVALVAAAAALPGAFIVEACLRAWAPAALSHVGIGTLFAQCVLLNETVTLLTVALFRKHATPAALAHPHDGAQALLDRLPLPFRRGQLYAVSAEDHYLRIHTDRGDTLIHMRMSEAEALLKNADGLRVHRSYWVARTALARIKRQRGQLTLILHGGLEAPVARSRVASLKQAAWLTDHHS
jgi:DNA-binding LytR/AlgR family response regulator